MGGIGTGVIPLRNRRLTSDAPRLPVRDLPKIGRTVVLSWTGVADASLTRASPSCVVISMAGAEIEVELKQWPMPVVRGRQRGVRTRFVCCRCGASRDAIHFVDGEWCCRGSREIPCGNLSFACRHRQRYCPAIARRERLRRRLIRAIPGSLRAQAIRGQIRSEEKVMVAHMRRVSDDLTKRSKRDARHRRATERT